MSNKYKSLAKDTGLFAIGNFGTKILSFLCVSLYTSYLTTAEFGTADLLITTITLCLPIFTLDISEAILRFLYDNDIDKKNVYGIGFASTIIAISISLCLCFAGSLVSEDIRTYSSYFVIIFALTTAENMLSSIIKGNGKTKCFAVKGILFTAVFLSSNVILLTVMRLGLIGYFFSYIFAYTISCIYMFGKSGIFKEGITLNFDKKLLRRMLSYSIPFVPASIAWWANTSIDRYMLLGLVGVESNGLYSVAQKVPSIVATVTGVFTQAWQLSAMQHFQDDDFEDYFSLFFRIVSSVILLGICAVLIFNKFIALFLFRNDFYDAWKYVPMLTVSAGFSTIAAFLASAFTSAKKTKSLMISTLVGAVVNIAANYALIRWLGPLGAALATTISFAVIVIIRIKTMKRIVVIQTRLHRIILSFIVLIISALTLPYTTRNQYNFITISVVIVILVMNYKQMKESFFLALSNIFK